jgi:hypothetical protein
MNQTVTILDPTSGYRFWWAALAAIPASRDMVAYSRLKRCWYDHTRFQGQRGSNTRVHRFYDPHSEDHETQTLWENFTLYPANVWVPKLFAATGLGPTLGIAMG